MQQQVKRIMFGIVLGGCLLFFGCTGTEAAVRIHFLALWGSTDAILLEDSGHFGLVDSGEDWDYPQGDDLKYPYRSGIVTNQGFETQVIHYLKSQGVTSSNLEFYIGTHAHSDHIGSGDEIVRYFKPKKLYLKKYADSNLSVSKNRWDNRYVYSSLLEAAKKNGVTVVQRFTEGMQLKLGSRMRLKLYNTSVRKNVVDENANAIVTLVEAYGRRTLLAADAEPDTMNRLLKQGCFSAVDILKFPHHGYPANNSVALLKQLRPKIGILTGPQKNFSSAVRSYLAGSGTQVRSTGETKQGAVLVSFSAAGYSVGTGSAKAGWFRYDGKQYYMDHGGRPTIGWKKLSGRWYYFNKRGILQTGWLNDRGKLYYLKKTASAGVKKGAMLTGWQTINGKNYYFNPGSGEMRTGWQRIGGKIFYLKKTGSPGEKGQTLTGWRSFDGRCYYLKKTGERGVKGRLLTGWQRIGGETYYFKKSGNIGWSYGKLLTGWQRISGEMYYFKKSGNIGWSYGKMLTGWQRIDGHTYYFRPDGDRGHAGRLAKGAVQEEDGLVYCLSGADGTLFDVQVRTEKDGEFTSMMIYNQKEDPTEALQTLEFMLRDAPNTGMIDGELFAGASGGFRALRLSLTGALAEEYNIYYQVYLLDHGWLGWAGNGELAGADGAPGEQADARIGALRIQIRPKKGNYGEPESSVAPLLGNDSGEEPDRVEAVTPQDIHESSIQPPDVSGQVSESDIPGSELSQEEAGSEPAPEAESLIEELPAEESLTEEPTEAESPTAETHADESGEYRTGESGEESE